MAATGSRLTREMYDVRRTAKEVYDIYAHVLNPDLPRPASFDSRKEVELLARLHVERTYGLSADRSRMSKRPNVRRLHTRR